MEDMIIFLSCCAELERRCYTKRLFEVCFLRLNRSTIDVRYGGLGSANEIVTAPHRSSVICPLQFYLQSLIQDCSFLC